MFETISIMNTEGKKMEQRIKAIIRLFVALVPVANIVLVQFGKSPLPFTQDEVNAGLSAVVAVLGIFWAWWKNNNMTKAAQSLQETLDELKEVDRDEAGGEGDPLEVE